MVITNEQLEEWHKDNDYMLVITIRFMYEILTRLNISDIDPDNRTFRTPLNTKNWRGVYGTNG